MIKGDMEEKRINDDGLITTERGLEAKVYAESLDCKQLTIYEFLR